LGAAFTLLLCGIAVLTAPLWGATTHTFFPGGTNWANAWPLQLNLIGTILCLAGSGLLFLPDLAKIPKIFSNRENFSRRI
jgi:hypothetical protein